MPDSPITPVDRTVVVHRFGALTYISLGFNALFLVLILIGMVRHHDEMKRAANDGRMDRHEWADRDGGDRRGGFEHMRRGGHQEGFGGPGGGGGRCEMGGRGHGRDFGMQGHPGWGGGDRPGFGGPRLDEAGGGDHGPMTPPTAEQMTDRFMLMMTQKLTLTDQESAQIRPIVQAGIAQFQKDMETQKQAHQKMIDDAKTKVRAVLTPDQQKQFDEMTARMGGPEPR